MQRRRRSQVYCQTHHCLRKKDRSNSQIRDMTQSVTMLRASHAQALKRVQDELLKARNAEVSAHIELQDMQDERVKVSQELDTTQQELTTASIDRLFAALGQNYKIMQPSSNVSKQR
eukprot:Protomagalhaensia_sp_Gyna_25__5403@NODE_6_length_9172_cov_212_725172_g5_i0_p10_GENE_NODE_6_length_9172_cov_212_725172_g5_i0NODE_6_length_9172_cov_212_725172_g5_i0_p10_ORF_typecomplete_len117_score12_31APG6_N/PF17675_1/0_0015WEMBL/PF05701_11/0_007Leu_zip/PF15294_6/0_015SF3b1/PF08920_10/0_042HrpB7/PF09486_10/0_089SRI/PF08236_11/0_19CCCAP/PF15964_5/0_22DMPK_coil/PF08826_10/1_5e03DMPK_coil/PF08826_10/0_3TarH/PF02203_15/2_7Atg14/PF10186_9/1_7_NODE_6_length_9172_cov_212_725172_g5_i062156565